MLIRKGQSSCDVTRGFTLIELLVVIAILSVLTAVLMPSICRAREIARKRVCQTRLKDFHTAAIQRSADYLGYVAKAVGKECYVVTKEGMVGNEGIRAQLWGHNDLDNHYWQRDYPLHYMGLEEGYFATAFACPSQSEETFINADWNRLTWEGQRQTDQGKGIGYGMTQTVWNEHMAPVVPLPGGNFLVAQGWWPGWSSIKEDYAADRPEFHTSRTYVRGLHAVSNLVAFGDSTAQQCNAGNYGFRHHGGCGYQDWYKNVVFWDGHVGDDKYLESKDENWYDELILAGGG